MAAAAAADALLWAAPSPTPAERKPTAHRREATSWRIAPTAEERSRSKPLTLTSVLGSPDWAGDSVAAATVGEAPPAVTAGALPLGAGDAPIEAAAHACRRR